MLRRRSLFHCLIINLVFGILCSHTASAQNMAVTGQLMQMGKGKIVEAVMKRGDAKRGAILFHQAQHQCSKCHTVDGSPSKLGPNLSVWEKQPEPAHLVESVLAPSEKIREGYQTVSVLTDEGAQHIGILVSQDDSQVVLRDAASEGRELKFSMENLDDVSISDKSIMPEGLIDQMAGPSQFYDLARYVIEIAEQGPKRAAELQPPTSLTQLPPLPDYEANIDHARLIGGLDDAAFDRGERIYNRVCANCHGTHDREGSLPTSPRFAESKLKNGSDPYRMYQTLTHGFGLMVAQRWMVPRQKYDVIHFIREEYFREDNPKLYKEVDADYLTSLPKGDTLGPEPAELEKWVAMNYGPSMSQTFEIKTNNSGKEIGRDLGRGK